MKIKKRTIIFVEGSDGTGKTTVVKGLSSTLGLEVIKMRKAKTAFRKNCIELLSYSFNKTLEQFRDSNYVVDRGPISSLVYSEVYQRNEKLDYIIPLLEKINPIIIYLTASKELQLERKEKDEVIDNEMRIKVSEEYEKFYNMYLLDFNFYKINTDKLTAKQVLKKILLRLEEEGYIEL